MQCIHWKHCFCTRRNCVVLRRKKIRYYAFNVALLFQRLWHCPRIIWSCTRNQFSFQSSSNVNRFWNLSEKNTHKWLEIVTVFVTIFGTASPHLTFSRGEIVNFLLNFEIFSQFGSNNSARKGRNLSPLCEPVLNRLSGIVLSVFSCDAVNH